MVVLAAGSASATPGLTLVGADGIDAKTGYLKALPKSLEAGRGSKTDVSKCSKLVVVGYGDPHSVLVDLYLAVGNDGKVISVDTETDPSTGFKHKHVSPAAKCLAPIVKTWTLADRGTVILRFVLTGVPVKRAPKVPDAYVEALTAVCAAVPKGQADMSARIELIKEALGHHPSSLVEGLLASMGGFVPATQRPILDAMTANAGIAKCPALTDL